MHITYFVFESEGLQVRGIGSICYSRVFFAGFLGARRIEFFWFNELFEVKPSFRHAKPCSVFILLFASQYKVNYLSYPIQEESFSVHNTVRGKCARFPVTNFLFGAHVAKYERNESKSCFYSWNMNFNY